MIPRLLSQPVFAKVAILLGDPRCPDRVKPGSAFSNDDAAEVTILKDTLAKLDQYQFIYLDHHASLIDDLRRERPGFVMNFCDNGFHNNPQQELHIPALLEIMNIPYSGAGPDCLLFSYDKFIVSQLARRIGVPTPEEILFTGDFSILDNWSIFPAMVKPNAADNSVGITERSVVYDPEALKAHIKHLLFDLRIQDILVQEFLPGTEYRVTMIGNSERGFIYLPTFEWDYSALPPDVPPILTHDSKYDISGPYDLLKSRHSILSPSFQRSIEQYSEALFKALRCRDCAKIDYRLDRQGQIKLVEFNPNPSWDAGAYINQEDIDKGYHYIDILRLLIEVGQIRYAPDTSCFRRQA
ncbi:MAG: D-alanine--D-alanine ligase [Alphaproteobacteria bacterium]|nr:D-alanine--D-alanine ligase [Alphaproteobacteria bacterium]